MFLQQEAGINVWHKDTKKKSSHRRRHLELTTMHHLCKRKKKHEDVQDKLDVADTNSTAACVRSIQLANVDSMIIVNKIILHMKNHWHAPCLNKRWKWGWVSEPLHLLFPTEANRKCEWKAGVLSNNMDLALSTTCFGCRSARLLRWTPEILLLIFENFQRRERSGSALTPTLASLQICRNCLHRLSVGFI